MEANKLMLDLAEIVQGIENPDTEEEYLGKAMGLDYDGIIATINYGKMTKKERTALSYLCLKVLKLVFEYTGHDMTSDENYDKLHEFYKELSGENIVGVESGGNYSHKYPRLRGTTEKIHFMHPDERRGDDRRKSYVEYLLKITKKYADKIGNNKPLPEDTKMLLSLKIDGVSAVVECDENGIAELALKRGDTTNDKAKEIYALKGIDFSEYVPEIGRKFGLKLEIAMTESNFEEFNKRWGAKTPRSAVTSVVNSEDVDPEKVKLLSLIPLQYQYEGEDEERPCYLEKYEREVGIYDYSGIKKAIGELYEEHLNDGIPADGVVFRILDSEVCAVLGREDNVNLYECAYKFPADEAVTTLKDVKFSLGILGGVTPVAVIEPVTIKGITIDSPSLGSMGRFRSLKLRKGQKVLIRHDVIPYLTPIDDEECNGELIPEPTDCPFCGVELTRVNEELFCQNQTCPGLVRGRILNFVEKTDIGGISEYTIMDFHSKGLLNSIPDLYRLHEKRVDLFALRGYGKKSIDYILSAIDDKRKMKDYVFLGALGIRGVGRKLFQKIMEKYSFDEFMSFVNTDDVYKKLNKIKGVGDKYIADIKNFFEVEMNMVQELLKEITIVSGRKVNANGMNILFTKVRDYELEEKLEQNGHTVMDGYNKSVDIVVVPDKNTTSSKVEKARKDGKLILTIPELKKELGI